MDAARDQELWDQARDEIIGTLSAAQVLATPGVMAEVVEHYNNDIFEVWNAKKDEEATS